MNNTHNNRGKEAERVVTTPAQDKAKKSVAPVLRFLYLLIAPVEGWKRLKNEHYPNDYFARALFYPLLALMAVSCFASKFYQPEISISALLQQAVAEFVAMFAGYFAIGVVARSFMQHTAREKIRTRFGCNFIMTALSALSLAATLYSLFPNLGALLIVIPIYVAYIIAKGTRFLRLPDNEQMPTIAVLIVLILGIPTGIYALLKSLMPSVG